MKISLTLNRSHFANHNEIITLPEDTVEVDVVTTSHAVGDIILTVNNGVVERQYKCNGTPIDITELCKTPTTVKMAASLCSRGRVLRTWQIEPLCIREIPGGFEAIPQITALEMRIDRLEKAIADLVKLIN